MIFDKEYCREKLKEVRAIAKAQGIKLPKKVKSTRASTNDWYYLEGRTSDGKRFTWSGESHCACCAKQYAFKQFLK